MDYRIGSMNMFKFSSHESTSKETGKLEGYASKKSLEKIAQIIREMNFDIVALQEVYNQQALNSLLYTLRYNNANKKWDGRWASPKKKKSNVSAEGYAFIWNTDKFHLAKTELNDQTIRYSDARIFEQYSVDRSEKVGQRRLIRDPFYARFVPKNPPYFELRLINVHIVFSQDKKGEEDELYDNFDKSDAELRQNEFDILTKALFPKIQDKIYGKQVDENGKEVYASNRVAYTIILGDYNLSLRSSGAKGPYLLKEQEEIEITRKSKPMTIRTIQRQKTSLRAPTQEEKDQQQTTFYDYWSKNYDHVTYNSQSGIRIRAYRVDSVAKFFDGNLIKHRDEYSDHVPIYANIGFKEET